MKHSRLKRPFIGACTLVLACLATPSHAQDTTEGRAFYDQIFSHSVSLDANRIPESDRLSYEQYERCLRLYRDIEGFNVKHRAEYTSLLERQAVILEEQSHLAIERLKVRKLAQEHSNDLRRIAAYHDRVKAYNRSFEAMKADLEAFMPVLEEYRGQSRQYADACARMYYDEGYMDRLPEDLNAEFRVLIDARSEKEG